MAGKNQVLLTFAGDSSDLEKSMDRVGSGAEGMGRKVGDAGDRFDRVGEQADNLDTRAMGFRDTLTGVEDTGRGVSEIMKGNLFDGVLLLGMGFGDLASGVANFGTQFVRQAASFVSNNAKMVASQVASVARIVAGWVLMGVQATINAAKMAVAWLISLGPIGLVIAAVGAVIGILVALGVGFDDIANVASAAWGLILAAAQSVWNWLSTNWPLVLAILTGPIGLAVLAITRHWGTIRSGFTAVKDWIAARVTDIVGFFTGMPARIASAVAGLWNGLTSGFKGAINGIIRAWNNLSFTIGGGTYDPLGRFGPAVTVPSFTFSTPTIPYLHSGGTFEAPPGQREGLAMLLDGERVSRPGASAGPVINIYVAGSIRSDRDLVKVVRDELTRGGFGGSF